MPPKKKGRKEAVEPEGQSSRVTIGLEERMDRMEKIVEGLVQVVQAKYSKTPSTSEQPAIPVCPNCQRKHWGKYRVGSSVCYGCGREGHQVKDCPKKNRAKGAGTSASASVQQPSTGRMNDQSPQGRAFAPVLGNLPTTTSDVSGMFLSYRQLACIFIDIAFPNILRRYPCYLRIY